MKQIRPDHVGIYVRWSTDDQSEGTTLDVQLEGCRHYALSQGWIPKDSLLFIDDGYSGANLMRPALTRLRALVKAGAIDCVVVFKVDRLSRNIVDAVELVLNEWNESCFFKSAREPIDTSNDLGRIVFGILAMFADFERSQIKERTQSGKVKRIAEGAQLHGVPAFGFRPSGAKGKWEENPEEAELVRRMFRMAAGGQSANVICRTLNQEGIRTRAAREWSLQTVIWILHNRLYIGEAIYGRSQLKRNLSPDDPRKTVRTFRDDPLVWTNTRAAPRLVDDELFAQANAQLERNKITKQEYGARSLSSRNLLVGLARCRCGGTLISKRWGKNTGYYCNKNSAARCGHNPGQVPQGKADEIILTQFMAMYGSEAAREDRLLTAAKRLDEDLASMIAQRSVVQKTLTNLDEQDGRVLMAIRSGALDPQDLRALRAGLERDRQDAEARTVELDAQVTLAKARVDEVHAILERFSTLEKLDLLSTAQKRELLRSALAGPIIMFKAKGTDLIEVDIPWAF